MSKQTWGTTSFVEHPLVAGRIYNVEYVCPSVRLCRRFLGIGCFFSKFWHGLETYMKFCVKKLEFWSDSGKNGPKMCVFNLLRNLAINFFWIWSIMKVYYYMLCPSTYLIFGKNLDPEIWAKMHSANQIARLSNKLYI